MEDHERFEDTNPKDSSRKLNKKILVAAVVLVAVILVGVVVGLEMIRRNQTQPDPATEPSTQSTTEQVQTDPATEPDEPVMLDYMAELYAQNPEIVGWLKIEDTVVDYPVMHTPDDPQKYIRKNFEGGYSVGGTLFIDGSCSMDPQSDNLIIYGHNMKNGTMFSTVKSYEKKSFWEKHPEIQFTTLYEERTYEVLAAFYDRVYYKYENVFKFYQFIDAETEEDFDEAISYFKENSVYDTGVTAEYGDSLIMLVTCSYHTDYGRFVVVAREKTEDALEITTESQEMESEASGE